MQRPYQFICNIPPDTQEHGFFQFGISESEDISNKSGKKYKNTPIPLFPLPHPPLQR